MKTKRYEEMLCADSSCDKIAHANANLFRPVNEGFETIINLSDIASLLIHEAGRWCKRYASDFIITWDDVREKMNNHVNTLEYVDTDYIVFGFRKNGVDSNHYLENHINNGCSIDMYYSEVYTLIINDTISDENSYKTINET